VISAKSVWSNRDSCSTPSEASFWMAGALQRRNPLQAGHRLEILANAGAGEHAAIAHQH
jgi:hypothetical protein